MKSSYQFSSPSLAVPLPARLLRASYCYSRFAVLSRDGDALVVGAPDNDDFCESCGHVRVLTLNLTESSLGEGGIVAADADVWIPVGSSLGTNQTDGGKYGSAVAVSSNGTRVVGSAPFTTFNGFVSNVGQVHVFDLDEQ